MLSELSKQLDDSGQPFHTHSRDDIDDHHQQHNLDAPPDHVRGHPLHRHRQGPAEDAPHWQHALWQVLEASGATEMEEEGPVAHLNSHFISHQFYRDNDAPRPIRLDVDVTGWEESIRFIWEDEIDEHAPLDIYMVQPVPGQSRDHSDCPASST